VSPHEPAGGEFPTTVFDALPFPAFVVDEDLRLLAFNPAADRMLRGGGVKELHRRGGEALQCINSADGCGKSAACPDCVIRNSVTFAISGGQPVRRRTKLEYHEDGHLQQMQALVTASPITYDGRRCALLWFENLTLLFALTDALPVCTACRQVRDQELWLDIEACLEAHTGAGAPLGLCGACAERFRAGDGVSAGRGGA